MKTVFVQKRGVDWYRNRGRLIRILTKSSIGYLIQVSNQHL